MLIENAASGVPSMTSSDGLAAGSLFRVDTYGFYRSGDLTPNDSVTLRLRTAGGERDLTVFSSVKVFDVVASISALLPEDTALGEADIVASATSGKSFSRHVWVVPSAFGLFSGARN